MIKIDVHDVCLSYGRKIVLSGLTFQLRPGEIVGLIGPNGCGKSTVIRALSHIIVPYSGRILLGEQDITRLSRRDLARSLAVVPQMPLLPSAFMAFEIVLMGRNPHLGLFQYEGQKDLDIVWQAMRKTGTQSLAERRVGELSGGEIQGLLIARALAQETKVILLDEPTANLDIGRQVEVLDLIRDLCREDNLVVLASLHDLNLAAQYCDRLILINNGQIHTEGTPSEVITSDTITSVYGAERCVYAHPANGLPCVLLGAGVSRNNSDRRKNSEDME
ncbi:ABC transporter ATP-binding protein [Chloroflexota bacterium]